jgi:hypothetical protein
MVKKEQWPVKKENLVAVKTEEAHASQSESDSSDTENEALLDRTMMVVKWVTYVGTI